ncbi:MAG TPA: hypothetical protein VG870_00440, partial [Chitinophagaceae bacterium]|nr:hypothetical protein [Chitinophagaceae bacterium]
GSAFGNIGLPAQPSQEMFENRLALALRRHSEAPVIWLEDESQRIGDLNIPHELWKTMRRSPLSFLEIPFDQRLAKIVQDYGGLDRTRLLAAIGRIRNRLGGLEADQATRLLEAGDLAGSFRILLTYYDKFYIKGLHNRENLEALLTRVPCDRVEAGNAVRVLHQIR